MKYIDEARINGILAGARVSSSVQIDKILEKSRQLKRLSIEEAAALLAISDKDSLQKLYSAAAFVKNHIYGPRVVLFAPIYISNLCSNNCLYCAFKSDNPKVERRALTAKEITSQTEWLLKRGHKRILVVSGEAAPRGSKNIDYYIEAIKSVYSASFGPHKIRRVNINCAPLNTDEFRELKKAGIGTFQIFQETYHESTYRTVHPKGPKSDPDNRLDAIERAFKAGIDDVGIGALLGLYDYRFEVLALLSHVEALENIFGVGPHTISVPRIEPAVGLDFEKHLKYRVSDEDFKKLVAVLRLAVPYT
ncbi:MAG TPA: radical SAM protein, partial [Candidatus Omnitrophota bacterium]|nr:radical SAM protein [Candidatus Omnitrophota bacterium]